MSRSDVSTKPRDRTVYELADVANAEDLGDEVVLTRDEFRALVEAGQTNEPSPVPANEEGPHLKKPEIREAKRIQLQQAMDDGHLDAAVDADVLTNDMRDILAEV